jgi:caspase 7
MASTGSVLSNVNDSADIFKQASQMEKTAQNVADVSNAIDFYLNGMTELEKDITESSDLKEEMYQKYGKMRRSALELCRIATQFPPQQNTSLEQVQADLAGSKKIITNLFQLLSQPASYAMFPDRRPRGLAIVIGIENFEPNRGLQNRKGCKFDVENFTSCFESVGYKVDQHHDITRLELRELMKNTTSKTNHTDYDSFVFCISTHGKDDCVYCSDGKKVDVYELVKMVRECPTLLGKPKLFFIAASRNTETTRSIVHRDGPSPPPPVATPPAPVATPPAPVATPPAPVATPPAPVATPPAPIATPPAPIKNIEVDTAIFWATTYNNCSHRDPSKGSWFVMALNDVFQENSHQMSLMSMMYLVTDKVARMEGEDQNSEEVQQCVATTHQLRGDIYFF